MTEKEMYLQSWEREFQTTLKVLKAYPADKLDFKPHERSRSARELAWTFVEELAFIGMVVKGQLEMGGQKPKPPATMKEILAAFESSQKEMAGKVKSLSEADYNSMIKFPIGPKQMGDFRKADVLWMIMMDQVHHRGQFSVYLRMAGGKVPSIYGPTADEPWM
ncbi:MAG: DinB family protein [bacterium]